MTVLAPTSLTTLSSPAPHAQRVRSSARPLVRSRRPIVELPDFAALRSLHRSWLLDDLRANAGGGPLARYARFLRWSRPDDVTTSGPEGSPPRCPDDLALAITFLTPRAAAVPDGMQWRRLLDATNGAHGPNPYDVALAWTAGWRGDGVLRRFIPGQIGEPGVLALVEQVQAALHASVRLLAERTGIAIISADEIPSMAAAMGMALLGGCDCGHHLRACLGCGTGCCYPDHDLRSWDPAVCHLRPFLDQAIRGTAQRRIMGGAFAAGMLFRVLEREGRLMCRTVEWGSCETCGRTFEGVRCPEPHAATPRSVRREPRKNQLILPPVGTSGHVLLQRWWCEPCRHLFGAAGGRRRAAADCPRCARTATGSKTVWTLTPPQRQQLDL